jgi:hypothetical protein
MYIYFLSITRWTVYFVLRNPERSGRSLFQIGLLSPHLSRVTEENKKNFYSVLSVFIGYFLKYCVLLWRLKILRIRIRWILIQAWVISRRWENTNRCDEGSLSLADRRFVAAVLGCDPQGWERDGHIRIDPVQRRMLLQISLRLQKTSDSHFNKNFREGLTAYFPFTIYWVRDTTRTVQKTPRPAVIILLRVHSLLRECFYWAVA